MRALLDSVKADFELLQDPKVTAPVAAAAVRRVFHDSPASVSLMELILADLDPGRARAVAAAGLSGETDPSSLLFAADVAILVDRDPVAARAHLARVPGLIDHPVVRVRLPWIAAEEGRLADAVEGIESHLRANPEDFSAGLARGRWLEWLAALDQAPKTACPCRSGRSYRRCCRERAQAQLERFVDRKSTYELRGAVLEYALSHPSLREILEEGIAEWVEEGVMAAEDVDWSSLADRSPESQWMRLAVERAWSRPVGERDDPTILLSFWGDPLTPPELARRSREWADHAAFGLWQVEHLGDPGTIVTEYLSGTRLYVQIPPEQRGQLRKWAVLLGYFVPVDGVWRSGSAFAVLTPREGQFLASHIVGFVRSFVSRKGNGRLFYLWAQGMEEVLASHSWVPGHTAALTPLDALIGSVETMMFPALAARLKQLRATLPAMTNTDGQPLEWIEATLSFSDPQAAKRALLDHPDFEQDDEDEFDWAGREMSPAEYQQALATMRHEGIEPDPRSQSGCYSRGTLTFQADGAAVQVNSRARLESLLALLRDLGTPASVVSESITDVGAELEQRHRWLSSEAPGGHDPEADRAWLRALPDQPIPALNNLTPRQAATRPELEDALEVFLREIEYQAQLDGRSEDPTGLRALLART